MTTYKQITAEQKALLDLPLPAEAVTQHPTKTFLSSIKTIYVTERLNEVFGVGAWRTKVDKIAEGNGGMIVVKVTLTIPEYGIEYESFGGNNNGGEGSKNFDLGDAYKGATTDAISKIASWMGIGAAVFKGLQTATKTPPAPAKPQKKYLIPEQVSDYFLDRLMQREAECVAKGEKFRMNNLLQEHYIISAEDYQKLCKIYESYKMAKLIEEELDRKDDETNNQ